MGVCSQPYNARSRLCCIIYRCAIGNEMVCKFPCKIWFQVVRLVSYHRWRYHHYNAAL